MSSEKKEEISIDGGADDGINGILTKDPKEEDTYPPILKDRAKNNKIRRFSGSLGHSPGIKSNLQFFP